MIMAIITISISISISISSPSRVDHLQHGTIEI